LESALLPPLGAIENEKSRRSLMELASELRAIRTELNSAHADMLANEPDSALGDMIIEELGAIWRSIDALEAAIESISTDNGRSIRPIEFP